MSEAIIHLKGAKKTYQSGDTVVVALDKTTETLNKGELTLIMGPSGSGKTTLLSLIGCIMGHMQALDCIALCITVLNAVKLSSCYMLLSRYYYKYSDYLRTVFFLRSLF